MRLWLTILLLLLGSGSSPAFARRPLDSAIVAFARDKAFSGTILIADKGRTVYARSFGLADRAFGTPVSASTRFKVGSIAKLFTSVLILRLHDQGKLDPAAAVQTYLPELKGLPAGSVTVHQLLNHTSGLPQ